MTDEQKDLLISILRIGIASGMDSVWECYENYLRMMQQALNWQVFRKEELRVNLAFAALLQGAAAYPEDPIQNILAEEVPSFVATQNNQHKGDSK